MKAVLIKEFGGPENLYIDEVPDLELPGHNEVTVAIKATALNRADTMQRKGNYPPPKGASEILGLEMSGIVKSIGSRESLWEPGDKVCGLLSGGGYAEKVCIHESMLMPLPTGLTYEEAAGIPEVFLTAYQALVWLAKVKPSDTVCIHAGASGVGTAAIQIATKIGAKVIVTASAGKHRLCKSLGAEHAIDYKTEDFEEAIKDYTKGHGADVIIDFLAAPYFQKNLNSAAIDGRIVMLSLMGGSKLDHVNLADILRKRIHILGSTLRSRSRGYKIQLTQAFIQDFLDSFMEGSMTPVIDSVYSWNDVAEAHAYMESNRNAGKIILKID